MAQSVSSTYDFQPQVSLNTIKTNSDIVQSLEETGEILGAEIENILGETDDNIIAEDDFDSGIESGDWYEVTNVIDGDTIEVAGVGKVRLIGVDTPETLDPRKPVQCFGREASSKTKEMLLGEAVRLENDPSQGDRDKYARALRYVFLEDGTLFNELLIEQGYAHEYTYNIPYRYMDEFKAAEAGAQVAERGLWSGDTCNGDTSQAAKTANSSPDGCVIKGNISTSSEKIYHLPGQKYYDKTVVDESKGERWFCSEPEAQAAGWRKSKT